MATLIVSPVATAKSKESARHLTVCHFTTAHTELKSRSLHRQFQPLAAGGMSVRYLAPVESAAQRDGVDITAIPPCNSRFRRILALPWLLTTLLNQDASLYHFQDPELLPLALTLKLIFRKRVIYDAYEDFPSMIARKTSLLRLVAARLLASLENVAARSLDGIVTADPFTLRRLARRGNSKKLVFYNFPNLNFFPPPRPRNKQFDLVYRGGLSRRTGVYDLLAALHLLKKDRRSVRLLLIGYFDDAAADRDLRTRISSLDLDSNIEIRGRLDHEAMADALSEARIGISALRAVPKFVLNIPVKVFEYWACGLPVISTDLPPIRPFFRDGHAGLLVNPKSPSELAQAVAHLLDNAAEAARMGGNGRQLVEQRFNNNSEVHKLRRFCERIATIQ